MSLVLSAAAVTFILVCVGKTKCLCGCFTHRVLEALAPRAAVACLERDSCVSPRNTLSERERERERASETRVVFGRRKMARA